MKVHLLSCYPVREEPSVPEWLRLHSRSEHFELTADPIDAELILFAETYAGLDPYFLDVIRHPVFRRFTQKCVLYHISDITQTLCRTISPSIDKNHSNLQCRRSFSYVVRAHDNPYLNQMALADVPTRYLFSFVGDPNSHPIRSRILALERPDALLKAVTGTSATFMNESERAPFQQGYLQTILESQFVLCPRGHGPTSMRLFEVMQLGRVPVIIGDSWLPVSGIPWQEFAIFVPETEIEQIPQILGTFRHRAIEMGARARAVWGEHFSSHNAAMGLLERACELLAVPYGRRERILDLMELRSPSHWRILAASVRRILLHGAAAVN
ncbi:exostosin domain-containing protein [Prosthecobacter fluviatilis]|uniref:Exostosin family protein n=1 Tax=Prosthecobacter fluviatilis TaxID=445931 RepID=A0ABW0KQM1_9BACT